jgi:hypothetical protein
MGYSLPSAPSIFPLNQALALPARSFSYELQRRLFNLKTAVGTQADQPSPSSATI